MKTRPPSGDPRDRPPAESRSGGRFLLVVLVLALTLPFLFKPFHIDDRSYLEVADNARENPLYPYDYPPVFEGLVTPDAASHSHLPLTSYYLALLGWLAGGKPEWFFHLGFLVFPLLAVWAFRDLAVRYTRFPTAAACLLIAGPGFLVLSHSLMTEVPLLAFWLLSISRFIGLASGEGRRGDWVLAGLALVGAALISLLSLALLLLLGAFLWAQWRSPKLSSEVRWGLLLLLLLPLVVWVGWYVRGYLHYDRLLLVRTVLHMDQRAAFSAALLGQKLASLVLNLGGALLFPAALWFGFGRARSLWLLPVLVLAPLAAPWLAPESWTRSQVFLLTLFAGTGLLTLWGVCRELAALRPRLRESGAPEGVAAEEAEGGGEPVRGQPLGWLLGLWFAGICASALLLYPSGGVRYSLLLAPPLILLWLKALEQKVYFSDYFLRNLVWLGVFLTIPFGVSIAYGDYRFARMYQQEARQLVADYGRPERQVWFTAEWGLRYYLEESGARLLPRTALGPRPGDVIIKPRVAFPWVTLFDGRSHTRLLEQRPTRMQFPIRLLDFESHAGFYSTGWGILPWSWADGRRWEWYNIYEVLKEYEGPIPEQERHW